jgi:hypothetical protein
MRLGAMYGRTTVRPIVDTRRDDMTPSLISKKNISTIPPKHTDDSSKTY